MKVKILRGTGIAGKRAAEGEVVEVSESVANTLIHARRAELYVETEKPKAKRGRKPKVKADDAQE